MKMSLFGTLMMGAMLLGAVCVADAAPDAKWTYKTVDGKTLKMDVFLPPGYESGEKFPTMVLFHGGSWKSGTADMHHADCTYWSRRGMIAVSVDYRLQDRNKVEVPRECMMDANSAIRFLRTNAEKLKVAPDTVVVAGASAGGQLAASTAMIDHVNDDEYDLSVSCKPNALILYNPYFKCAAELSPPTFVNADLPPCITFLGGKDPVVSVEDLKTFHEALKAAGNASAFYVGKNGKHGFCIGRNPRNRYFYWSLELADAFLVKHGILTGQSVVKRPKGIRPLTPAEFDVYP
jgi:acetyl esterase/lipase